MSGQSWERKHRKEVTELERKHLTKMAQTVERAEAEIGRDQEVARWKLELASGYETQIKGLSLEMDGVAAADPPAGPDPAATAEPPGAGRRRRHHRGGARGAELLHRDREEQSEQIQQLGGLVRVLCQYYQTAERLYRPAPPPGRSADPEAEATDRMVLEALAPDEGPTP
ncbi:uncharacterized protein LOC119097502 [Pollicipes pollicipes]|uniref:uncharacterized protein LOC119097502 n=1 Tax=Pollicipes pollicipes TaxID=41117 RepID=UPI00188517DF|nr:uncharacterized protein LOC119097502 [Pollicipes pollicipes]